MATRNINGLTAKQQVFCDLYRASEDDAIRGNAKRCYMFAYGATAKSADANGPRLLKDKHVKAYLDNKTEQVMDKFDIQEEDLLREAANIAFLDPADFFDENGNFLPIQSMPEKARRALSGFDLTTLRDYKEVKGKGENEDKSELEYEETTTSKIKFIDKKSTIELLMKYKKMLTEKIDLNANVNGGVLVIPSDAGSTKEWLKQNYPSQK